jgi:hypothetical protein
LIPVDPTTIVLRVTETGGTPTPPDTAYAQFIAGKKIAEFNTDELLYECMRSRSYNPYGLAPIESLIIQVESALRGSLYNLDYFRENNIPEGFITLPEEQANTLDQTKEWQLWFDQLLAGNSRTVHRLKILPGGSEYTAAKKPEDMSFERFEKWLLTVTCAVFDVPPRDIGITDTVNKASDETQENLSKEKGLIPLASFIKEIMDDIISVQLGFDALELAWTNLNPTDHKEEAEIAEREIKMGATSVDEYRIKNGLEPIGLDHYIIVGGGRVGEEIAHDLTKVKKRFVIIEKDPIKVSKLKKKGYLVIEGDANDIESRILDKANIKGAAVLVIAMPETEKNLLLTLMAKEIKPEIDIYVRCDHPEFVSRLKKAGAKSVIVPEIIAADQFIREMFGGPALC